MESKVTQGEGLATRQVSQEVSQVSEGGRVCGGGSRWDGLGRTLERVELRGVHGRYD